MPLYDFEHPETGEIFSDLRPMSKSQEPFHAPDGVACDRLFNPKFNIINRGSEVFQLDEDYTRLSNPKFVRFKDGHKEKYNPTKHIGGKGMNSDTLKPDDEEGKVNLPSIGRPGQKIYKRDVWWEWDVEEGEWKVE